MRIQGTPRAPVPIHPPGIGQPQAPGVTAARSPAVGPAVSFGKAVPIGEPTATVDLARGATFDSGGFERGGKLAADSGGGGPAAGPVRDATEAHPLYGRYVRQWTAGGGSAQPGQSLLSMMQQQLGELKDGMRSLR
jgi:hypothetical protein